MLVLAPLIVKLLYVNAGIVCAPVPLKSTVPALAVVKLPGVNVPLIPTVPDGKVRVPLPLNVRLL